MDFGQIAGIVTELGATGALIVVFAYTFLKIMPQRDEKFLGALKEQREDFREEMGVEREAHQAEISKIVSNGKANAAG